MQKPTKKQTTALALIANGMSAGEAMRKAGFSVNASRNPKQNLYSRAGVIQAYQSLELDNHGLNETYLASKIKQFMEAKKTDPDDYKTQTKGAEMLIELKGLKAKQKEQQQPVRRITFEEWVTMPAEERKELQLQHGYNPDAFKH